MPVTRKQEDGAVLIGYNVLEELEGQGQISVRDAINADLAGLLPVGEIPTAVAIWSVSVKVLNYDLPAVKTISGFPLRAQFGSITYYSIATFLSTQYVQHELQTFRPQRCIVVPINYLDVPYTIADIPAYEDFYANATATGYATSIGLPLPFDSLLGATGFYYDFAISAVVNVTIAYIVRYIDQDLGEAGRVLSFVNY